MTKVVAVAVGLALACGVALTAKFVGHAPEIAVAWGNAWAERERRSAAEDVRRAEIQKEQEAQAEANAAHNEANCKVIVSSGPFGGQETISGVRRITKATDGCYILHFGGGVTRHITHGSRVLKTENCH